MSSERKYVSWSDWWVVKEAGLDPGRPPKRDPALEAIEGKQVLPAGKLDASFQLFPPKPEPMPDPVDELLGRLGIRP